ncbi:MAG: hypothetical protein HGA85_05155 [Nanoarchaeota archaeon]|nr:hypothetical protein [Nanoarchaeota archaeon]
MSVDEFLDEDKKDVTLQIRFPAALTSQDTMLLFCPMNIGGKILYESNRIEIGEYARQEDREMALESLSDIRNNPGDYTYSASEIAQLKIEDFLSPYPYVAALVQNIPGTDYPFIDKDEFFSRYLPWFIKETCSASDPAIAEHRGRIVIGVIEYKGSKTFLSHDYFPYAAELLIKKQVQYV